MPLVLSSPFLASAGTTYWLSVFAYSPEPSQDEAQWAWVGGTGGDAVSVQNGGIVNFDRAFDLTTAVPEPATMALLAVGSLLLFGVCRGRLFHFNR